MKTFSIQFKDNSSLDDFILSNSIDKSKSILVQIFSGIIDAKISLEISGYIQKRIPHANIIGATTCGEIKDGRLYDKTIIVSFSVFESANIRSSFYQFEECFEIENILEELVVQNTKALIIFSDGLNSNAEKLIKSVYALRPDIIIAGGRAADNFAFKKTYVFNEKEYSENACVVASLSGDDLLVNSDYILNWTPIGKDLLVTKAEENILYELDGMPIYDVYKKYLGEDVMEGFPRSTIEFPLIIKKDFIFIARDPIATTDDGGIIYAGSFENGDIVRFSFGNIEDIRDETLTYFQRFKKLPAESVFVYSCAARKSLMGEKLVDEINIFESLAPCVGFFTYGEYFHTQNINVVLNVTTTFLAVSESPTIKERTLKTVPFREYDVVKKVLTHLIKVVTQELEHISIHDALTGIYNRAEYMKRLSLSIKGAQRYGEYFGLMLIDIDYFKLVNDNYGHTVGDKVLRKLAKLFKENIRENDLVARWGGEEFVIIVNYATSKILEELAKKLQKRIEEMDFTPAPKITVSFGLTVYMEGDNEQSIFKRADNALYVAKSSGRNCYVVG